MRADWATAAAARGVGRWVAAVAAHPRAALAGLALAAALAVAGLFRLGVDTDSSRMLDPTLPFQIRVQAINEAFPTLKNTVIVAVRAERADPADAALRRLRAALEGAEGVAGVYAPAVEPFFAENGLLYLSMAELEERLTRISKSANLIATLREDRTLAGFLAALAEAEALAERAEIGGEALERLRAEAAAVIRAAEAGRPRAFAWAQVFEGGEPPVLRVLTVTPELDFAALDPAKAAARAVERAVAALPEEIAAEVEVGLTGDPVLRAEELRSVTATIGLSLALSLLLVAAVLWWALRSLARMGLALGALVLTLLYTAGAAGAAIGALNLVSVAFVVLMVGLGIDFAIHVLAHLEEDAERLPPEAAIAETGRALGPALVLTALTTAAAFLAFTGTAFVGMAQLGAIGAMGVLIAFAVAVTLLPAAVALRPGLARARRAPRPLPKLPVPGRALAWGAGAVGLAAAVLAVEARFDADPMALRDPEARSVEVYRWLAEEPDRAPLRLSLLVEDADAAAEAAGRIEALEEVRAAVWLGDLVPTEQDEKLALVDIAWPSLDFAVRGDPVALTDGPAPTPEALAESLPETGAGGDLARALAGLARADPARDARLEAALFRHFPALIDRLAAMRAVDRVSESDLPAALVERYRAGDGRLRVEILAEGDLADRETRARTLAAVARTAPEAGGPPAQIAGAEGAVGGAMRGAVGLALSATALLALIALGSLRATLAVLVPVALAGAVTAAATVLLGQPFNYANVIVLPLLIGLGVDAGIHLALRTGRAEAVFATSTPRAVLASALTTIGAFATLALSEHRGTASMGLLLAVAVAAAVAMTFALTPALARGARQTGDRP